MSIELSAIGNMANQSSMIGAINTNFEKIESTVNSLLAERSTLYYPLDCNGQALMNAVIPYGAQIADMPVSTLISTIRLLTQRIEALEAKL